jgi:hypothetical protein
MRDRLEKRFRNARQRIQDELGNLGITPCFFTNTTKEQATKSLAAVIKAMKVAHHPDHGGNSEKFKELSVIPDSQRNGVAFAQYVQRLMDESTGLRQECETGFLKSGKQLQDALARVGVNHMFFQRMTDEKAVVWLGSVIKQMLIVHHPDQRGSARISRQLTRILDWIKKESVPANFVKRLKEESAGARQTKTGANDVAVRKLTLKKGIKAHRTSRQVRKRKG